MNIDDEDPKVRRNLITFSSAIVLFAWLELPMKAVTEKFVSAGWTAEPTRVWLAIAGILIYLAVRFHFIGGGKEAFSVLGSWFKTNLHWQIDKFMKRIEGKSFRRKLKRHPLADALDVVTRAFAESDKANLVEMPSVNVVPQGSQHGKTWQLVGVAELSLTWIDTSSRERLLRSKTSEASYSLGWWQRAWFVLNAAWISFVFSERAIDGIAPVWLATTASFIVGFRLGTLWAS